MSLPSEPCPCQWLTGGHKPEGDRRQAEKVNLFQGKAAPQKKLQKRASITLPYRKAFQLASLSPRQESTSLPRPRRSKTSMMWNIPPKVAIASDFICNFAMPSQIFACVLIAALRQVKSLTWQNAGQPFVAQYLKKVKIWCCGIKKLF